jgi:hypothetical protein
MTCKRCKRHYDGDARADCPHCGEPRPRKTSGVIKTSSILIAAGGPHRVYRSVEDVPPKLRRKLIQSTNSLTAGTILIADRKGRQQLSRALRKLSATPQPSLLRNLLGDRPAPVRLSGRALRWVGLLLAALCLAFVWLVFTQKW